MRKSTTERAMRPLGEEFMDLPPRARRVAIAKDVIAMLEVDRLLPVCGIFVRRLDGKTYFKPTALVADVVRKPCEVCAKGALFVAAVTRKNGIKMNELGLEYLNELNNSQIKEYLRDCFDVGQLDLIEAAFENWDLVEYGHLRRVSPVHWAIDVHDPSLRMSMIMENIVKNGGLFKPERSKLSHRTRAAAQQRW
jgi:hypothetical protein